MQCDVLTIGMYSSKSSSESESALTDLDVRCEENHQSKWVAATRLDSRVGYNLPLSLCDFAAVVPACLEGSCQPVN